MPFFFILLLLINQTQTPVVVVVDPPGGSPPPSPSTRVGQFKPGIAVVVAILTTVFSLTFLMLLYVKHCRREAAAAAGDYNGNNNNSGGIRGGYHYYPAGRNSGVDRKVIESLPMFRFSSLTGHKDGLECAVCLNRFEPDEVLRLLPKCKHAFHVECVDTWLDAHSTCPLCRYRVDPEDVLLIDTRRNSYNATPRSSGNNNQGKGKGKGKEFAANPRVSGRHSSAGERGGSCSLEMIVEKNNNPGGGHDFRGRISLDSWHSRRKSGNPKLCHQTQNPENRNNQNCTKAESQGRKSNSNSNSNLKSGFRKDGQLLGSNHNHNHNHRLEHRIVISGEAEAAKKEEEGGVRRWSDAQAAEILYLRSEMMILVGVGDNGVIVNNARSVSEMTGVSRYVCNNGEGGKQQGQEERAVRRWLDWISQSQSQPQPAGHSAASATVSSISV